MANTYAGGAISVTNSVTIECGWIAVPDQPGHSRQQQHHEHEGYPRRENRPSARPRTNSRFVIGNASTTSPMRSR